MQLEEQVEQLVDVDRVARHIGFAEATIRNWAKAGILPAVGFNVGRRTYWKFRLSEVDAACKSGTVISPASTSPYRRKPL